MSKYALPNDDDFSAEDEGIALQVIKIQRYLQPKGYIKKYTRTQEDNLRSLNRLQKRDLRPPKYVKLPRITFKMI